MSDLPAWAEAKFEARMALDNGNKLFSCHTCRSLVHISDVKWHDKWHQGENYIDPEGAAQ